MRITRSIDESVIRSRCWCSLALLVALMGCRTGGRLKWVHVPPVERKSIEELYFEALEANARNPEHTVVPHTPIFHGPVGNLHPRMDSISRPVQQRGHEAVDANDSAIRPAAFTVPGTGPLVSEVFDSTDVRQAIQLLAAQAEVSVIIDEQVGGLTSAIIENEPFETALAKVLLPLGYVYSRQGDQYVVASDDPRSPLFAMIAETREYRPQHLSPEELLLLLTERQQQYVRVIDKRNLMMIEAPRDAANLIVSRLDEFDQPIPQVVLEAIICVINPGNQFSHGLDWNHMLTVNNNDLLGLGMQGLAFSGTFSPFGVNNIFDDFSVTSVFVKLLAQEGYLSIRAAPRVMAKDGEQASISINRETFFSIQPRASEILFRQDIEKVEAGISLDITPIIRGENITVLIQNAEVSEDIRPQEFSSEINQNPFPLINRRQVSTTVSVRDGETIVIGGLVTRQTVDRITRIPGLGELPHVGKLFRIREQQEQDVEVVIFISPRLVRPSPIDDAHHHPQRMRDRPEPAPAPAPVPGRNGPDLVPGPPNPDGQQAAASLPTLQLRPIRDDVDPAVSAPRLSPPRLIRHINPQ